MFKNLLARKTLAQLHEEMRGENRLRRVLGPLALTSLGIGCIIGAGIFVVTGMAAHDKAGPALMLSFVVAGLACVFAALCYAEFASMVPVAGSAYTYAYATLGELFAWIIGWDLILEYAVASATVAHGWSKYFQNLHRHVPPRSCRRRSAQRAVRLTTRRAGTSCSPAALCDLPADRHRRGAHRHPGHGIRESARFNPSW